MVALRLQYIYALDMNCSCAVYILCFLLLFLFESYCRIFFTSYLVIINVENRAWYYEMIGLFNELRSDIIETESKWN